MSEGAPCCPSTVHWSLNTGHVHDYRLTFFDRLLCTRHSGKRSAFITPLDLKTNEISTPILQMRKPGLRDVNMVLPKTPSWKAVQEKFDFILILQNK